MESLELAMRQLVSMRVSRERIGSAGKFSRDNSPQSRWDLGIGDTLPQLELRATLAEMANRKTQDDAPALAAIPRSSALTPVSADDDLPVVARMIVEIRSDGSRTIARGAVEDATTGQRVAVEARGDSPVSLAMALARSLVRMPRLTARAAVRGLLERRRK
jgi:hypothetical protein